MRPTRSPDSRRATACSICSSAYDAPEDRRQLPGPHQSDDVDQVLLGAAAATDDLLLGLEERHRRDLERLVEVRDDQELPARPQHCQPLTDARAVADVVDDDVDALAVGEPRHRHLERLFGRVDADGAVLFGQRQPLRPTARRQDLGARAPRDLHAVDAEAADAQDQHALPDADAALVDQAVVHAGDGVRQDRRRLVGNSVVAARRGSPSAPRRIRRARRPARSRCASSCGRAASRPARQWRQRPQVTSIAAVTRSPVSPLRDARAQLDDVAGELVADDPRQLAQRLAAGQEVQVGAAKAAGAHADEHLAGARPRHRPPRRLRATPP